MPHTPGEAGRREESASFRYRSDWQAERRTGSV